MDTSSIVMLRIDHRTLTLRQLLQRLRIDAMLADINRCKDDLAIECWADEIGFAADAAELQSAVNRFRREQGLFTAAQANEWLGRRGMALDELVAILKPQALRASLQQRVVSEEDIRGHYLEFAYRYDRVEISIIVTVHYGAAQELLFRAEEGADFHALARAYSSDAATAKSGGYAGLFGRAEMEPETAAAVWGAVPGAIVGPFERRGAYRLILVEGLYPAELNAAVEAAIREQLFQERLEAYRHARDIHEAIWSIDEQ